MPFIRVNDMQVFYRRVGEGTPCLVLHGGLGFDHSYLYPWLNPLADRLQLIYYDQRSHGRSERMPPHTISFAQLADDAEAIRVAFDLKRVVLFAHSGSVPIAMEYALRWPEHVSGLVLAAPVWDQVWGPSVVRRARAKGASSELLALTQIDGPLTEDQFREGFAQLAPVYFHQNSPGLFQELFCHMIYNGELVMRTRSILQQAGLLERLNAIRCPTLIVVGDDDIIVSPLEAKLLADRMPNAELAVVSNSGHFSYAEQPDAFFLIIKGWLKNHL